MLEDASNVLIIALVISAVFAVPTAPLTANKWLKAENTTKLKPLIWILAYCVSLFVWFILVLAALVIRWFFHALGIPLTLGSLLFLGVAGLVISVFMDYMLRRN